MKIKKNVPGYSLKFDVRPDTGYDITVSDKIVIAEMFDENTYQIHDGDFLNNKVMVDIGANIGAASILAWTKGAREIYAYEPEQHNYQQLLTNIKLNKLGDCIIPIKLAIAEKSRKAKIFDGQGASFIDSAKGVSDEIAAKIPNELEEVDTIGLDGALAQLKDVALLKMDCEGGEYNIIAGASVETLKKCNRIVMEYHRTDAETFGAMVAKLSLVFHLTIYGSWQTNGGQLDGKRY